MRELIMRLGCHFTDDDKEKCIPTIHKLVKLSNIARTNGIMAVEAEAEQTQCFFLKTALLLVVDGTSPIIVKQILQNLILADEYSGSQLLDRLLIAEGVLALQQGENPNLIALMLYSMLGEKYMQPVKEEFPAWNEKMREYSTFMEAIRGKEE